MKNPVECKYLMRLRDICFHFNSPRSSITFSSHFNVVDLYIYDRLEGADNESADRVVHQGVLLPEKHRAACCNVK